MEKPTTSTMSYTSIIDNRLVFCASAVTIWQSIRHGHWNNCTRTMRYTYYRCVFLQSTRGIPTVHNRMTFAAFVIYRYAFVKCYAHIIVYQYLCYFWSNIRTPKYLHNITVIYTSWSTYHCRCSFVRMHSRNTKLSKIYGITECACINILRVLILCDSIGQLKIVYFQTTNSHKVTRYFFNGIKFHEQIILILLRKTFEIMRKK